jgi:Asp-tRNA(Asn)/Glu-tRNA(Gln) amidotransferase A subunit family amidase
MTELSWLSASELRELIASRELSPTEVTEHCLSRAEALEPVLRCFRTLDVVGAREQAKKAEKAVLRGENLGILHGIPVSVKEHIAVEGLPLFTAGLGNDDPGGAGEPARQDAPVVRRLRRAGAVVVGTNHMPGMGSMGLRDERGAPTKDLSFHSRNPWDTGRVPGSSSAGACAAVAGGIVPLAIGSDGGGSTRLPAAWSGLLGLHPTMGRVPMGQPPGGSWNVSEGPLSRTARDGALALQAISGPDGAEIISLQTDPPNYVRDLGSGIDGVRMAWSDDFGFAGKYAGPESMEVVAMIRGAAFNLEALGATVEPSDAKFPEWSSMLALGVTGYQPAPGPAYERAQDARVEWWQGFRTILTDYDVLLTPTIQHVAFTMERWEQAWSDGLAEFSMLWCAHTFPHNFLGWPALSVPCGFVDGLPVGLQITGRPDSEALLYRVAESVLEHCGVSDRRPNLPST